MKRKILTALIIASTGFIACKKADPCEIKIQPTTQSSSGIATGGCIPPPEGTCEEEVICTAVFAAVTLSVSDATGTPVHADSFVVTNNAGIPLPPATSGLPVYGYLQSGNGHYTVINDAWVHGHQNTSLPVRAKGFKNGSLIFDEPFVVKADYCHVSKVSGRDAIIVQ